MEVILESEPEKAFLHVMRVKVPYEFVKEMATLQRHGIKYSLQQLVMRHEDPERTNSFGCHRQFLFNIKNLYLRLNKLLFNSLSLSR